MILVTYLATKYKLYADDLKAYANSCSNQSIVDLNISLQRLLSWCDTWQMNLAIEKCFCLPLMRNGISVSPLSHFSLYDQQLQNVENARDLGVIVDQKLNFNEHISLITHKALTRCKLILKCFKSNNISLLLKAYVTYVRPLLEYCCTAWSPHNRYQIEKIEKVQRYFTKRLPGMWLVSYSDRLEQCGSHFKFAV